MTTETEYRNPTPQAHHPYCQFRRDLAGCTCAEGRIPPAERLRAEWTGPEWADVLRKPSLDLLLDDALAAERRATVERIRERLSAEADQLMRRADEVEATEWVGIKRWMLTILDEEAARNEG